MPVTARRGPACPPPRSPWRTSPGRGTARRTATRVAVGGSLRAQQAACTAAAPARTTTGSRRARCSTHHTQRNNLLPGGRPAPARSASTNARTHAGGETVRHVFLRGAIGALILGKNTFRRPCPMETTCPLPQGPARGSERRLHTRSSGVRPLLKNLVEASLDVVALHHHDVVLAQLLVVVPAQRLRQRRRPTVRPQRGERRDRSSPSLPLVFSRPAGSPQVFGRSPAATLSARA